jgi:pantetheine-phosphate adenylyltransferase
MSKRRIALYPGSFNPWHQGHGDIYQKALKVFDKVIIGVGINPEKIPSTGSLTWWKAECDYPSDAEVVPFKGLLVNYINDYNRKNEDAPIMAIIRGLRSGYDLQYEQNMQYWNEDLGLEIPTVYFITDRMLGHISSSSIRSWGAFVPK